MDLITPHSFSWIQLRQCLKYIIYCKIYFTQLIIGDHTDGKWKSLVVKVELKNSLKAETIDVISVKVLFLYNDRLHIGFIAT